MYDLGAIYDICDLEIKFQNKLTKFNYFDVEVSRDNQTYLAVKQNLSSTKTDENYDAYSISRKARYIKIICRGNEFDDWNAISDVKIYSKENNLSIDNNNLENTSTMSLFPVPTKNILKISGIPLENTKVEIYDIKGALIQTEYMNPDSFIDTSKLISGMYFIKVKLSNTRIIKKFIVQ